MRTSAGYPRIDRRQERDKLNARIQAVIEQHTDPWGIKVQLVEMKQVGLPPLNGLPLK
jgi:regulator of protease activity HflC (stomatin/prohibitin superfamily)